MQSTSTKRKTTLSLVKETVNLLVAPKMLCIVPLFFYMGKYMTSIFYAKLCWTIYYTFKGNSMVYYGSQYTRQIRDQKIIGYAMAVSV